MQIKVNLKIFFVIILFIITNQIKIYGILMWFAFLHELGHLIIGIALGFRPQTLSIKPVGLSISFKIMRKDIEHKVKNGTVLELKKVFIGIAGPITNLILGIVYLYFNIEIFSIPREIAIYSNILIGLFNLLPVYPLDGGRIIKSILHILMGFEKSEKYIKTISWSAVIVLTIIASITILYIKNIAVLMIIIYIWGLNLKTNKIN